MDPLLRREVELPLRAHQRAPFYLGLASLLLSLLVLLDAALCSHPPARPAAREPATARERAAARAHAAVRADAAVRLSRSPCRQAARRRAAVLERATAPDPQRATAPDPQLEAFQEEFRRDAARQLERPWAAADYPAPAGPRASNGMLHAPHMPAP